MTTSAPVPLNVTTRPRRVATAVFLTAILVVTQACAASNHAVEVPRVVRQPDWMPLLAVAPGTPLTVGLRAGRQAGRFEAASDREIEIREGDRQVTIARSDVCQVITRERHYARHAQAGALKGGAFGALLGAAAAETSRGSFMLIVAAGWAAIGAVGGLIDGAVEPVDVVLYRVC